MSNFLSNLIGGATGTLYGQAPGIDQSAFTDPYAQQNRAQLAAGLAASQNRVGVGGQGDPFRVGQLGLVGQLQAQAEGRGGPSLAEMQLKQASDRNLAQQQGAMASNRGVGAGLAARLIGQQGAEQGQNLAANAAQLRAQEQMNARQQLAAALEGGRSQDLGQQGLNDQMARFYQQAMLDQSTNAMTGAMGYQNAMQNQYQNQAGQRGQFLSALGNAGTLAALM